MGRFYSRFSEDGPSWTAVNAALGLKLTDTITAMNVQRAHKSKQIVFMHFSFQNDSLQ
jgi:hypothetical protein